MDRLRCGPASLRDVLLVDRFRSFLTLRSPAATGTVSSCSDLTTRGSIHSPRIEDNIETNMKADASDDISGNRMARPLKF